MHRFKVSLISINYISLQFLSWVFGGSPYLSWYEYFKPNILPKNGYVPQNAVTENWLQFLTVMWYEAYITHPSFY